MNHYQVLFFGDGTEQMIKVCEESLAQVVERHGDVFPGMEIVSITYMKGKFDSPDRAKAA